MKNLFKVQLILYQLKGQKTAIWEWETTGLEKDKERSKGEWGEASKTSVLLKKIHQVINSPVVSGLLWTTCGISPTWGHHEHKQAEIVPGTEQQERVD